MIETVPRVYRGGKISGWGVRWSESYGALLWISITERWVLSFHGSRRDSVMRERRGKKREKADPSCCGGVRGNAECLDGVKTIKWSRYLSTA